MILDVRTMYVSVGVISFVVAGALLILQMRRLRQDGALEWAVGWAFHGAFWVLLGLRGIVGDFLSIVVANTLFTASYCLLYAAVRRFRGRSYNAGILLVPVAATSIFEWYFSAYVDNILYRIIFMSLLTLLQIGAIVWALLSHAPVKERLSYWLTGFGFLVMIFAWLNRLLEALTLSYGQLSVLHVTTLRNPVALALLGGAVLSGIGFVLMIRQRTEEEVRRKEEELREAQRITHIGSWYWNAETDATTGSDELLRIYGLDPTTESMPAFREQGGRLYPRDSWQKVNAAVQKTLETGVGYELDVEASRAGAKIWVTTRSEVVRDANGQIVGLRGTVQDITDRKEAEEALRGSTAKLGAALNSMTDAVFISDADGNFIEFNDAFATFHRFRNKDECWKAFARYGEIFEGFLPDGTLAPIDMWPVQRALRGEIGTNAELNVRRKDTGERWVASYSFGPISDKDGVIVGSVVVARDITERKQAEEALRESERRERERAEELAALFEAVPMPVFIAHDPDCLHLTGNRLADEILRISHGNELSMSGPAETKPLHFRTFKDGRELRLDELPAQRAARGAHVKDFEFTLVFDDGLVRHVLGYGTPLLDGQGHPRGTVAVLVDITDRKRAEEALRKAHDELELRVEERTEELQKAYEKLKEEIAERERAEAQLRQAQKMEALGTLTGGIAHDFNNILAAIIGFTELLHDHVPKGSREVRHTARVLEAALRGRDLVRQMLTFSRRTEQEKKPLQLSGIVKESVRLLRASIPTTISIRTSVKSESGVILGDPVQIQQVLMNLATNAAYAMREKGGVLDIELSDFSVSSSNGDPHGIEPGLYMKLVLRDTGIGIPPDIMERIFDPFFTTKGVGEGTGLGLSVVLGIVRQSNGYIFAESEPGKGSVFTVYFPKIAGELDTDAVSDDALPTGFERILFVDDEEALVEMGEELLAELGYEVICRTSSKDALALLQEDASRFDLVITDQTMPEMTGVELAKEILTIRPDMPIIMCTGFSHLVNEASAREAGINSFVMKPLTKREIAKTVREVLDG